MSEIVRLQFMSILNFLFLANKMISIRLIFALFVCGHMLAGLGSAQREGGSSLHSARMPIEYPRNNIYKFYVGLFLDKAFLDQMYLRMGRGAFQSRTGFINGFILTLQAETNRYLQLLDRRLTMQFSYVYKDYVNLLDASTFELFYEQVRNSTQLVKQVGGVSYVQYDIPVGITGKVNSTTPLGFAKTGQLCNSIENTIVLAGYSHNLAVVLARELLHLIGVGESQQCQPEYNIMSRDFKGFFVRKPKYSPCEIEQWIFAQERDAMWCISQYSPYSKTLPLPNYTFFADDQCALNRRNTSLNAEYNRSPAGYQVINCWQISCNGTLIEAPLEGTLCQPTAADEGATLYTNGTAQAQAQEARVANAAQAIPEASRRAAYVCNAQFECAPLVERSSVASETAEPSVQN